MSEKIILTKEFFIARGWERDCYINPLDSTKVIKITHGYSNKASRNQNDLEYKYFEYLKKLNKPFSHITKCYGYIDTNLGKGIVSDKVYDYNGKISMTFLDTITQNKFTKDEENELVEELKEYIFKNSILFIDIGLCNILCCEYEKEKYRLMIIDGLGAKRTGIKFWLYLKSELFTKYKIRKQWKRFLNKIDRKRKQYNKKV
ncbi:PhoP regulatory network YrbL family protein [Aliarcobacter cryaerophilus]|uniref:PhoP regulatory network YrbL family protein n=1 Tax=Aliarcobacter cryaerophilus TaxID=28198 RepID=UPI0021B5BB66|nr:PhoP regulatory network YrbL family protein [Aliarcobacter cryaerophilus]MCT7466163.1 PhoP regulatory network YrbL family protein [Aliarcobacter cryaerophilus]